VVRAFGSIIAGIQCLEDVSGRHGEGHGRRSLKMPTVAERLRQVTLKVERPKCHIADLERETRAFLESNPYRVGTKRDPDSRKLIHYVTSVEASPERLPLIAGDALQNLMSALDHLAYQLVCSDTDDRPANPNWICFPIQDTAAKYETKKSGKIQGARQETYKEGELREFVQPIRQLAEQAQQVHVVGIRSARLFGALLGPH
jgi:hypothetical protein